MTRHPTVEAFFDPATHTVTYLVADAATGRAAIIDPVLDFDPAAARTSTGSLERVLSRVTGLASIAFGVFLAYQIGFVDGLFGSSPSWNPH